MSERFGACPTCHKNDGYINSGKSHWFMCVEHRVKWCPAANLFSSWMYETAEEQREQWDKIGMDTYTTIEEPYHGEEDTSDDEQRQSPMEDLEVQPDDSFDESENIVPTLKTAKHIPGSNNNEKENQ
jgi:hypothetical protein